MLVLIVGLIGEVATPPKVTGVGDELSVVEGADAALAEEMGAEEGGEGEGPSLTVELVSSTLSTSTEVGALCAGEPFTTALICCCGGKVFWLHCPCSR